MTIVQVAHCCLFIFMLTNRAMQTQSERGQFWSAAAYADEIYYLLLTMSQVGIAMILPQ